MKITHNQWRCNILVDLNSTKLSLHQHLPCIHTSVRHLKIKRKQMQALIGFIYSCLLTFRAYKYSSYWLRSSTRVPSWLVFYSRLHREEKSCRKIDRKYTQTREKMYYISMILTHSENLIYQVWLHFEAGFQPFHNSQNQQQKLGGS